MRLERGFHAKLDAVRALLVEGRTAEARTTFDTFWRATRRVWRGMAARLYQRWTPPTGCSPDDVEQELSLAVWALLVGNLYDSTKGRTLADYIIFNACNQAKYWLHKQRGAILHGNRDKHPTRAPTSFDPSPHRDAESAAYAALTRMRTPDSQERVVGRKQALLALLDTHQNVRDRFALVSLYYHDGNVPLAARYLYAEPAIRQLCRFGSEAQAALVVRRTARVYLQPPEATPPPVVQEEDEFSWASPAETDEFDWAT